MEVAEFGEECVNADGVTGLDGFQERDFDEDFFGAGVFEAGFAVAQDFHDAGEAVGGGEFGLFGDGGSFGFGNFEETAIAAGNLENEEVAEMAEEVGEEAAEVFAVLGEVVELCFHR